MRYPAGKLRFVPWLLFFLLASCVTERGDVWDGMVENYVTITSKYEDAREPEGAEAIFDRAMASFKGRRYQDAQLLFGRFVSSEPAHPSVPMALFHQGECFYNLGVYPQALRYYDAVIEKHSMSGLYLSAFLKKGYALRRIGRKVEAHRIFTEIVKGYPGTKQAEYAGQALETKGPKVSEGLDVMWGEHQASRGQPKPAITALPVTEEPPVLAEGRGYAVVIGISIYAHESPGTLDNLLYADQDARAFAKALEGQGWNPDNIRVLINEQATRRNVTIALDSWLTKAGPEDVIVLFWSGHGFADPEDPEKVYFACHDTDIRIPATGYRMDHVHRSLEEKKAQNVLVFADTCHAGKLITRGGKGVSIVPQIEKMRRENKVPKGWIFMVGADTDRQAIEHTSWTNGAFTHCLLKGLKGEADGFESSGPKNGVVTMGELRSYLNAAMPDVTQRVLGVAKRAVITTSSGDPEIWGISLRRR